MSSFVLCSDKTFEEKYRGESHRFHKMEEIEDLLGYAGIHVYVHDDWHMSHSANNVSYLEEQLEALAMYKYIKLYYIDEWGTSAYHPPEDYIEVSEEKQKELGI